MSSSAEYWVGPTIGEGSFGHVVYAVHKTSQRKVAIKVMNVLSRTRKDQQQIQMILNERKILEALKASKWIVDLWAAFCETREDSTSLFLVMELATGGDLQGLIQRGLTFHRGMWLEDCIPYYAKQLIGAVDFLHSKTILHCDLKPQNVLLDATTRRLFLADFGCALDTKGATQLFPRGTALYAAPELLRAEAPSKLTSAVDHWSVGCILYAMFHGMSPFDRGSEALTVRAVFDHIAMRNETKGNKDECEQDTALPTIETPTNDEKLKGLQDRNVELSSSEEGVLDGTDSPLFGLWKGLTSAIPEDRLLFWDNNVLPLYQDERTTEKLPADVLLPEADWKDPVGTATLRDGALGLLVFEM